MSLERAAAATLLLMAGSLVGCSYADRPDLRPGQPSTFEPVSSRPAPTEAGVALAAPIDLFFNDPPDPATVGAADLRVFSGVTEAAGTLRVDLLEKRLRMQPLRSLRPELRYQVSLSDAVRGLDGAKLTRAIVFDFTTGADEGTPPPSPPQVSADDLQPLWTEHCTSCHSGPEPPMSVDLSSPDAVRHSLRSVPSSAGLLQVVPGDHASSYLMRKLLGEAILGSPMPPDGPRLSDSELRRVADWIDTGAN